MKLRPVPNSEGPRRLGEPATGAELEEPRFGLAELRQMAKAAMLGGGVPGGG